MNHFFNNHNLEFRITYLSSLGYFLSYEQELTEDEKQKYFKIVDELGCKDAEEDLYEFIKNPHIHEIKEILELSATEIDETKYAEILLEDIDYIYKDHKKMFFSHKKLLEWVSIRADIEIELIKDDAQQLLNELNYIK